MVEGHALLASDLDTRVVDVHWQTGQLQDQSIRRAGVDGRAELKLPCVGAMQSNSIRKPDGQSLIVRSSLPGAIEWCLLSKGGMLVRVPVLAHRDECVGCAR